MSKHKIRCILPLLAIMTSAACVGAAGSSDKTNEKDAKQQNRAICPVIQIGRCRRLLTCRSSREPYN